MEKEFIFSGFIDYDYIKHQPTITLVDKEIRTDLIKKFRSIFDLYECEVGVSYFICDKKTTEKEIQEHWLSMLFGNIRAEYEVENYYYSELTNGTYYDSYLEIGGHNLFEELKSYNGKYCIIKVTLNKK